MRSPALIATLLVASCSSFEEAPKDEPSPASDASTGDVSTTGCAALFCASFDGPRFDEGWAQVADPGGDGILGSSFARSEDRPRGGPAFLRWTTTPGGHFTESNHLRKDVTVPDDVETLSLAFAFRLTKANTATNDAKVQIASLGWGAAPDSDAVTDIIVVLEGANRLVARVEQDIVLDASPGDDFTGAARLLNDAEWHVIRLDVAMPLGGRVQVAFHVDDSEWETHSFTPGPRADGRAQIRLGGREYGGVFDETILDFDELTLSR